MTMGRQSAFVKVSGDLCASDDFITFLRDLSKHFFVVVCVGGGSQINAGFAQKGTESVFGPLGREIFDFPLRQHARDILEGNQASLQDLLADECIPATVIIPVLDIGTVLCHINGDTFVETVYLGFDALYVVTTEDRVGAKQKRFQHLPKVVVVGMRS